jgi:AcrR family transcriptional regulator
MRDRKKKDKKPVTKKSTSRRTHAERSAATQHRLYQATIDLLYSEGYSATTTISVAKKARVSRGAMLHQYPTRERLLLNVAEQIAEETRSLWQRTFVSSGAIADVTTKLQRAGDLSSAVYERPSTIALLEIMLATRSDANLRKGFQPIQRKGREWRSKLARRLAQDLGTVNVEQIEDFIALHQVCMRGMAIEFLFAQDRKDVERLRAMLREYEAAFLQRVSARKKT